jgi:hypothetical protein
MYRIFSLMAALLLMQYSMVANAVPAQLTTTMGVADFPDYRIDAGGNLHLVWFDASVDSGAILYTMQSSNGTELIPPVQVNTGGSGNANTWPAISAVGGFIYIVWQKTNDGEVWFMRLNPSLAPLDGSAVLASDIRQVEKSISTGGGSNAVHPRIRGVSGGDMHVVWESTNGGPVEYMKVDTDGFLLNGPVALGGAASGADLPDVDVDTNGHAHVVFGNNATTADNEIYYAMIDGTTGLKRIDATLLSTDDGLRAGNVTVNVDTLDNTLYLVFKQALVNAANGAEEIFLARLNPSLDDQDGSAASAAAIKLSESQITNGEGLLQWSVTSRIGLDKRLHATYIDFDSNACPSATPYTITDAHITFDGKIITRDTLTTTGAATGCFPQARLAPLRNRIVWPDSRTGATEIWSNVFSRVETGSRGFTCSLGGQDRTAWRAGDLWLLLGLLVLLAVRRSRRFS